MTVNGTAFEVPPPGAGLKTVTEAVVATVTSEAGTVANSLLEVTKVVASVAPFQFTTEVETNPVPFTVRVNPGEPGTTLVGTRGWLTSGTGLDWATRFAAGRTNAPRKMSANTRTEERRSAILGTS